MTERKLLNYSIMPLDTTHLDKICEDICNQYESSVASNPAEKHFT